MLSRLFGRVESPPMLDCYTAIVALGRQPHWYEAGQVPDTLDGRFDMIATVLAMVMLRLEAEPAGAAPSALLAERFVDDMDGQVRQIGFGDMVVGKHIGKMMGLLGGRIGAYRQGLAESGFEDALVRNLYRGEEPAPDALGHVADSLLALRATLAARPLDTIMEGALR